MTKRAFTLIELLIVLAIFGLVMGLGYPQIKRIYRSSLRSAAAQMAGMIRYGYDISVIKGRIHRVVFDFDNSVYRLEVSNTDELVSLKRKQHRTRKKSKSKKNRKAFPRKNLKKPRRSLQLKEKQERTGSFLPASRLTV